jgi:peptidyl-dipeptidase A
MVLDPSRALGPLLGVSLLALATCSSPPARRIDPPPPVYPPGGAGSDPGLVGAPPAGAASAEEAVQFVAEVDAGLRRVLQAQSRADWINATHLTDDTNAAAAEAAEATMEYQTQAIKAAARYAGLPGVPAAAARQIALLRHSATLPAPADPDKRKALAELSVSLQAAYGKGTYCSKQLDRWAPKGSGSCLGITELSKVLADPKATWEQLVDAYTGWRTVSPPMQADYQRFVELGNQGAREQGFTDVGAVWKSRYDMPADAMEAEVERLWGEVKPLYDQLHCYVRTRLSKKWKGKVPASGPMPAHVFGNMWSQAWGGVYAAVEPFPGQASLDVTKAMVKKKISPRRMTEIAENFFVSLGMPKLPESFWQRSMIEKPRDREVVCHASAWDLDYAGDVRIKMCTQVTEEDLVVLHHELGHIYYFLAYNDQPILFQDGANDGFHEAIGDTIALSVTPGYLADTGILDKAAARANPKAEMNLLMRRALDKVAFLPFGLLIDKWRWDVFAGKTPPERYNQAWWDLVLRYQGIVPPGPRPDDAFDPGAKYHVPANTPYLRYFLSHIYQFQFHRALCQAAGHTGPLHTCSIYGNRAAGDRLWAMLQLGSSKPWPEAMKAVTGDGRADATALLEYFAPLQQWLTEQNQGQTCGW